MMKYLWTAPLALAGLLAGCGHMGHEHAAMAAKGPSARAELAASTGQAASGTVMFHTHEHGVFMHARISGLKPGQEHGFHVHEKGDCSGGDGMRTGGHFNPTGKAHGHRGGEHHAGDLPALKADANGVAEVKVVLHGLTISSGVADIVGRGLIVHAQPDDYKTQPTGNSGARIACAVITRLP
jgi:superoxide dismutase, Cu-Zn family